MPPLKTYIRYLLKNKLYTIVTVLGFAFSLAFIVLISIYINNELSVDDFHVNKERIYRIENEEVDFSGPIAVELKDNYPEIEEFTRVYARRGIITHDGIEKKSFDYLAVDGAFFDMFSYPIKEGSKVRFQNTSNALMLSETFAVKLFGSEDPIGKKVSVNDNIDGIVVGVFEDLKSNTHLKPVDVFLNIQLMSKITYWDDFLTERGFCSMGIFFLEKENTSLRAKTPKILERFKENFWLYKEGRSKVLEFTPLKEVYFSNKIGIGARSSSLKMIRILSLVVLLILIFSISNYINLTIAQASFRSKEVAIKKLIGSSNGKVLFQFLLEAIFITFLALAFAIVLTRLLEPIANEWLRTELNVSRYITLFNILKIIVATIFLGIISGIIPALSITKFNTVEVVKGTYRLKSKKVYRKWSVILQYTASIALLSCSYIIIKQTHFLRNLDLGFAKKDIIHIDYLGENDQQETIKNALKEISGVEEVSTGWGSPLDGGSNQSFTYNGVPLSFQEIRVDKEFFKVFEIEQKSNGSAYDKEGIYLNESAFKQLSPTGETLTSFRPYDDVELKVLGTVDDFNFERLSKAIGGLIIHQQQQGLYASNLFIKLKHGWTPDTLEEVRSVYKKFINNKPFELKLIEDQINHWYDRQERFSKIIASFTLLSIVISSLGVLAMSLFYFKQRQKEIGIRNVIGATSKSIYILLTKDFSKQILIAMIIASPIGIYFMKGWLQGFAYKIDIEWYVFFVSAIVILIVTLMSVSIQAFQMTKINPVKSLKAE